MANDMRSLLAATHPAMALAVAQSAEDDYWRALGSPRARSREALPQEIRRLYSLADDVGIVDRADGLARRGEDHPLPEMVRDARERLTAARGECRPLGRGGAPVGTREEQLAAFDAAAKAHGIELPEIPGDLPTY